jgi:hypothetical protein
MRRTKTPDRWAPPVSVHALRWRTGSGRVGLAGPGWLAGLGQNGAPDLFSFLSKHFSFSIFETKGFVLKQKLHKFESLQISKICKMG